MDKNMVDRNLENLNMSILYTLILNHPSAGASLIRNYITNLLDIKKDDELYTKIKQIDKNPFFRKIPAWNYFMVRFLRKEGKGIQKKYNELKFFIDQLIKYVESGLNTDKKYEKKLQMVKTLLRKRGLVQQNEDTSETKYSRYKKKIQELKSLPLVILTWKEEMNAEGCPLIQGPFDYRQYTHIEYKSSLPGASRIKQVSQQNQLLFFAIRGDNNCLQNSLFTGLLYLIHFFPHLATPWIDALKQNFNGMFDKAIQETNINKLSKILSRILEDQKNSQSIRNFYIDTIREYAQKKNDEFFAGYTQDISKVQKWRKTQSFPNSEIFYLCLDIYRKLNVGINIFIVDANYANVNILPLPNEYKGPRIILLKNGGHYNMGINREDLTKFNSPIQLN